MSVYISKFRETEKDIWEVVVPDLNVGFYCNGAFENAIASATKQLENHIWEKVKAKSFVEAPSNSLPIPGEGLHVALRIKLKGKRKRYNVMLDEGVVAELDSVAENRSAFIENAIRKELTASMI